MTRERLNEILDNHRKWLNDKTTGKCADLSNVNLENANLRYADLRFAKLENTIGNGMEIKTFQFGTYTVVICKNVIQIGCKRHSQAEWWGFTDEEISEMDNGALEWWKEWKEVILKVAKGE